MTNPPGLMRSARTFGAVVLSAAVLASIAVAADSTTQTDAAVLATRACRAELAENGSEAFEKRYGDNPLRACTRFARRVIDRILVRCRRERNADPSLFYATYGTHGSQRDAYSNCIYLKLRKAVDPVPDQNRIGDRPRADTPEQLK